MKKTKKSRSIFRSLFVPLIIIIILQAILFYSATVYGGLEESYRANATDILTQRMNTRRIEVETVFNTRWTDLEDCMLALDSIYREYETQYGDKPFLTNQTTGADFLLKSGPTLIDNLRYCRTNGIFLILNDATEQKTVSENLNMPKYGLCIRDMDPDSNYSGTDDLLLERSPSAAVDALGCLLDSWWEAKYHFQNKDNSAYYSVPLCSAFHTQGKNSEDMAYFTGSHHVSGSDPAVISYSLPLLSDDGFPYAVLGVEVSVKYLESLLPSKELNEDNKGCYVLVQETDAGSFIPVVGTGSYYDRWIDSEIKATQDGDGYVIAGKDGTVLFGTMHTFDIYNQNNPDKAKQPILLAVVERDALFADIGQIKSLLKIVSLLSLVLGIVGLTIVSKRFAAPITALARKVRGQKETSAEHTLDRLGITEIDHLIDAIDELNRDVSRSSARTEFFSRMSHDMRTPMNAIISFSSSEMLDGADETLKNDYLNKIHDSGVYLLGLINEVLDMTKIESNKTVLHPTAVSACRLFDTSISMIQKLAQKKNITFRTEVKIPPELLVMVDEQHLNQVLMNLLSNAVKFTPENGTVILSAEMTEEKNETFFTIVIADTGIGMSPEFLKTMYTPFEQENNNHEGTGLGLTIAKQLVELMGGTIACRSTQNIGTAFTVTLPVVSASADALPAGEKTAARHSDLSALKGKCVLVCEDNDVNGMIVRMLLERNGMMVEVAENGKVGVEMFEQTPPDTYQAILMDIRMPVMNGRDATIAIRALAREDAATIPIIAMTADAFVEDQLSSLAAGMNEHLSKPVEPEKLYETLLRFLG